MCLRFCCHWCHHCGVDLGCDWSGQLLLHEKENKEVGVSECSSCSQSSSTTIWRLTHTDLNTHTHRSTHTHSHRFRMDVLKRLWIVYLQCYYLYLLPCGISIRGSECVCARAHVNPHCFYYPCVCFCCCVMDWSSTFIDDVLYFVCLFFVTQVGLVVYVVIYIFLLFRLCTDLFYWSSFCCYWNMFQ